MKKIPYGIIDFKSLITEGYEYIDKTKYLEKLERVGDILIYLRPRIFGKSLFTSMMFYYYDVASADTFERLFKDTHVYKCPTTNKNNYYCLKFDFSGMSTNGLVDVDRLTSDFKGCVKEGIEGFKTHYGNDYVINDNLKPDALIKDFLSYIRSLKLEHKLYIIIDEYDNFTNAILEGNAEDFLSVVGNAGVIKSFYANIKIFVKEGLVDRVFITGICPVTLNAMTTGFNIATDISTYPEFNSMIGFTHAEVKKVLDEFNYPDSEELFSIMLDNYDGYTFSPETDEQVFNSTLVMYYFNSLEWKKKPPVELFDVNIVSNYGKLDNLLKLQNNEFYRDILESTLLTKTVEGSLKRQFNLLEEFTRDDIISLLYYFGYLTIGKNELGDTVFSIPNEMMEAAYGNYFLKLLRDFGIKEDNEKKNKAKMDLFEGKIDGLTTYASDILALMGNRILLHFSEKNLQLVYYCLLLGIHQFTGYTEYECKNGYIDLYIEGDPQYTKNNYIVEFKYIKASDKKDKKLFTQKREEGLEQLAKYDVEGKKNVKKYLVIFIGNKDYQIIEFEKKKIEQN